MVLRLLVLTVLASAIVAACSQPPGEIMQLDGNLLTIANRTPHDWNQVEVWLNRQYRATAPTIAAGTRVQVSLDSFVEGFGHRFDRRRAQVTGLRLTATLPDDSPFETEKRFEVGGLKGLGEAFKKPGAAATKETTR